MNEANRVPPVDEPAGAAGETPPDRADGADRVDSAERVERADRVGSADRVERADRVESSDRVGSAGRAGRIGSAAPDLTGTEQSPSVPAQRAPVAAPAPAEGTDGDFELARPAPVPDAGPADAEAVDTEVPGAGVTDAGDAEVVRAEPGQAEGASWAAPAERPKPLHDPDPYSTPPYGEPGPWAPAPPVLHPAATPAHGTDVPAQAAPPAPTPTAPTPTAPMPAAPMPPAPMPAASMPTAPMHTTPMPPAVTPPAPAAATAQAPAPAPAPVPVPSPAPAPGGPAGDSAAPSADPWGRYDPWAAGSAKEQALARGPLQQTGAGVLTREQRRRRGMRFLLAWTVVVALVSAGIGGAVGAYVEREGADDGIQLPQAGGVPADRAPDSVAGIAARALPSVVTLHVRGTDEAGTGTGFVLDGQGHILTNNHVIQPAGSSGEITVTFSSGDTVRAKVVGRDSGYDLAVVEVHGVHGLTPLPLGNSDDVRVGDPVVAIGAPFDLANTVTSGIISAKERPITAGGEKSDGSDMSYVDALQTDAPINPGNSGGPLLDSRARVIGINSAIRSADSGSASGSGQAGSIGLGFAIPVNQAKRVAEELIDKGRASHPVIGVRLDMGYTGDGARIDTKGRDGHPVLAEDGPADRAGMAEGDVITEVDGERVHSGEELIVKIRAHRPGDRLRLTVERGGTEREISLVLGASEQN
ncbi:trypsin-like peptidase domain-containing protein [Streptomyces actinomycinicus]|uniref:Trypsin-like peptidase domain-containing protein n=1 Tax=Streptomyces actinomycinicus TaxID=1695166 RepID=A0A937ELP8_9ACTN|nr:trypsin-like peptidase domain-containing protein [Streptomyces actinomycinicus]MBL1085537.1 trypsin-like peptidase domain-containing protein [Streptomyces actinomycinicus]